MIKKIGFQFLPLIVWTLIFMFIDGGAGWLADGLAKFLFVIVVVITQVCINIETIGKHFDN
jgi:hypothetical protein